MKRRKNNKGLALLTAIIVMVILMSAVTLLNRVGRLNLEKSMNQRAIQNARLAAESGLNYVKYHIRECYMSSCADGTEAVTGLYQYFTTQGFTNVTQSGNTLTLSATAIPGTDSTFSAVITSTSGTSDISMTVTGQCQNTTRQLALGFSIAFGSRSPIFDFGFTSGGSLTMKGDCWMCGTNDPSEANIYMSNLSDSEVINISGTSLIEGKVFACHEDAYVDYGGSASVGGETGENIANSVYQGVDKYDLPQIDINPFVDAVSSFTEISTPSCSDAEYSNIKILANTNPTFLNDTTIKGVVYVESPNVVTFNSNSTITGVIVADTGDGTEDCLLEFKGTAVFESPENLPDTSEYTELKTITGTALLAEGFTVSFKGTSQIIGGTMAADSFSFKGNRDTTVKGSIICYGDSLVDTELKGQQHFWFDMSDVPDTPPGFVGGGLRVLTPVAETYKSIPEGHQ